MKTLLLQMKKLNTYPLEVGNKLDTLEMYFFIFLIGSIGGWIYELFFYWIFENRLSNNGFFYGPYLPIYGFGALFISLLTNKYKKHPVLIFVFSIPITGILEYVSGYVMYEIWAKRWWDYRNKFCNIGGYVCLRSVLTFAVGAILLIYIAEPLIYIFCNKKRGRICHIICVCLIILFIVDAVATVLFRMPAFA